MTEHTSVPPGHGERPTATPGWASPGSSGVGPSSPKTLAAAPVADGPSPTGQGWGQPPASGSVPAGYGYPISPGSSRLPPLALRPGIVPLRPLALGEIYDGAFQAMRRMPLPLLGSAAIVGAVIAAVGAVLQLLVGEQIAPLIVGDPAMLSDQEAFGALGAMFLWLLGLGSVQLVGLAVLVGVLVVPVSKAVTGHTAGIGEVWRAALARTWALIGLLLLLTGAALLGYVVALVPVIALGVAVSPWLLMLLLVTVPGYLAFLLWMTARAGLAVPALMLERVGVLTALRRSRELTRGSFWRVLGILLLGLVITLVAQLVLVVPFKVGNVVYTFANPDDPLAEASLAAPQIFLSAVGSVLAVAVVYPFWAGVCTLLYIDQRMRREGLDVELTRAAAAG